MAAGLLDTLGAQINAAWLGVAAVAWPAAQWTVGMLRDLRADRRSNSVTTSGQMATMIKLLQEELDRTNAIRTRFGEDLERLRDARWTMEDRIEELRDQAIAARAMVHELERRLSLPETVFPPLPHPVLAGARSPPAA